MSLIFNKLILKLAIAGLGVFGLSLWVLPSYAKTAVRLATDELKSQVPIEFEIERAGTLIRGVEPQIEACKRDVAKAEVDLDRLEVEVASLGEKAAANEVRLKRDAALLSSSSPPGLIGPTMSAMAPMVTAPAARERVALNLQRSLEALKNEKNLLNSKRLLLEQQKVAVAAARDRLDAVRTEKGRLEDMVRNLRIQQQQVEALAARSPNLKIDDSALAEAKSVLAGIKDRLDVAQKMLENDMVFAASPSAPPVAVDAVLAEIDEFLGGGSGAR